MADPMTLDEYMQTEAGQQMQVNIAGLSDAERETFLVNLQQAADEGRLADFDVDSTMLHSEWAEEAREEAVELRAEQAEAIAEGDYARAGELARDAEYAMEEVQANGGDVAYSEIVEVQGDQTELAYAADWAESAEDNAAYAVEMAEAGDMHAAEIYASTAEDYATGALDYADAGMPVDASVDMTASIDTSATSVAVETASVSAIDTSTSE
jgi:hypothetical protein